MGWLRACKMAAALLIDACLASFMVRGGLRVGCELGFAVGCGLGCGAKSPSDLLLCPPHLDAVRLTVHVRLTVSGAAQTGMRASPRAWTRRPTPAVVPSRCRQPPRCKPAAA